jgi:hypothetical protein
VLRADVRVANDRPANILKKTTDGRYLYVDGVASNILYYWNGERSNVEEQLNKLNKIRISPDNDNIIWNRADGFFASTKLDYNSNDNKLIFTTSTVNGQPFVKEIQLNTVEVIESITYDPTREVLVVKYKNDKGETKTIYVPVSGLIDEWEVLNDAHSVKLVKQRKISGKDILTADVNISIADNNILEERGEGNIHALFVRGTADNIKYKDTTVEGALDALAAEDEAINERLDEEIARATGEEQRIDAKLDQEIADRIADVDAEEARATSAETELETALDVLNQKLGYKDNETLQKNGEHEVAFGSYNISNTGDTPADRTIFSIGNGTADDARSNAFEVRENGDVYMWIENDYMQINRLLAMLAHEVYDDDDNSNNG